MEQQHALVEEHSGGKDEQSRSRSRRASGTTYSGTGVVSASFTKNSDKTYTGNFSLQATVAASSNPDSTTVTVSGDFTNLPYN